MTDAYLIAIKRMTNEELNSAAAMANYQFDVHYNSCPYCRNRRAQQLAPCTLNQTLQAKVELLEAEQEVRAEAADFESDQRAERRNEQLLSGCY